MPERRHQVAFEATGPDRRNTRPAAQPLPSQRKVDCERANPIPLNIHLLLLDRTEQFKTDKNGETAESGRSRR